MTSPRDDFETFNLAALGARPPVPDAPLIEVARVPNSRAILEHQFDRTYSTAHVPATRKMFLEFLGSPVFAEIAGEALSSSLLDDVDFGFSEIQANAERFITDPKDPGREIKDPDAERIATGAYAWIDYTPANVPRKRVPVLLVGSGDNIAAATVDDRRPHRGGEAGHGLKAVRSLAHAILVAPVLSQQAATRREKLRTKKVYMAAYVLGRAAFAAPENPNDEEMVRAGRIDLARSYAASLTPLTPKQIRSARAYL